jgi:quercetin dioxygenase-like cupin family protein
MVSGDIISLEANLPHHLTAKENSVIRLTIAKQDKAERVQEAIQL